MSKDSTINSQLNVAGRDDFECPDCGETFHGPRYLSAHSIREHREPYSGERAGAVAELLAAEADR